MSSTDKNSQLIGGTFFGCLFFVGLLFVCGDIGILSLIMIVGVILVVLWLAAAFFDGLARKPPPSYPQPQKQKFRGRRG